MPAEETPDIEEEVRRRQETAIDALHGLGSQLAGLETELSKRPTDEELRAQLKANNVALEYNRHRGIVGLWIGGAVVLVVLLVVGVPLLINSFANRATAQQIKECTTPGPKKPTPDKPFDTGHKCFDGGQTRTAGILTTAAANEIIVLSCYRNEETGELRPLDEFTACVKNNPQLQRRVP